MRGCAVLLMRLVVGVLVLLTGRKLFWLFVGVAGFAAGLRIAPQLLDGRSEWLVFVIALGAGVLGALLALAFQTVAIGVAGFVGGAYVFLLLLASIGWGAHPLAWVVVLAGGVIGAVLMFLIFDWTLVVLSSLMGASLIVEALGMQGAAGVTLFAACAAGGFIVQGATLLRERG